MTAKAPLMSYWFNETQDKSSTPPPRHQKIHQIHLSQMVLSGLMFMWIYFPEEIKKTMRFSSSQMPMKKFQLLDNKGQLLP